MNEGLHVFQFGDYGCEIDYVIARDLDDAWTVWCESCGESRENYSDKLATSVPDSDMITVVDDSETDPTVKTAGEWAASEGRGLFCFTGLHVWQFEASNDHVIARDLDDALSVWCETFGKVRPYSWPGFASDVPDSDLLTILEDSETDPVTKTAGEWAASEGRGPLCYEDVNGTDYMKSERQ